MDISNRGLDFIKRKEGFFDKAYLCPAGVWTIGWGTIRWDARTPVKQGDTITREVAEKLILKEVQRVEDAIDATIKVHLTQGMFDALCSLFYNIGIGWLTGHGHQQASLVKLLNKGEYDRIPSEFLKFKMANGKPLNGLLIRRKEEVRELWLGDYEASWDENSLSTPASPAVIVETNPEADPMPQHVEPDTGSAKGLVTESWTIKGALISLAATMVQGYEWLFSVAKEAGPEAVSLKQTVDPFNALLTSLSANMGAVAAIVCAVGLVIVISRRVSAQREGRIG
jgi:lysozyme